MHPLIRFAAALILLSLAALSVLAGPKSSGSLPPVFGHLGQTEQLVDLMPDSGTALAQEKNWATIAQEKNSETVSEKSGATTVRICSCQVLNLQSSNYDHRYVVLLAEKTNDESSTGYKAARNRIEKEKKQLKKLFYDKVKLVAEKQAGGSCKSMCFRLRTSDTQLQLYEILNAD